MKLFALSGSMRTGSYNTKLIRLAVEEARRQGAKVNLVDFRELAAPNYDGDQEPRGLPPQTHLFARHIEAADGIMIATPEYNCSVPGPLKNAIDWVSRLKPYRFTDKPVLLLGASSGKGGALQGIAALRITLNYLGARLHPEVFSVRDGKTAYDEAGRFVDTTMNEKLAQLIGAYLKTIPARASVS
jgi:NAD(P)H-dependent FMN reductase